MLKKMIYITYTLIHATHKFINKCRDLVIRVNRVAHYQNLKFAMNHPKVVHYQHKMTKTAFHFTTPDCFQCMKV